MLSLGGRLCVHNPDDKLVLPQGHGAMGKGVREINYALKFAFIT